MEKTLALLKPDCVHRRLVGTILGRLEAAERFPVPKGLRPQPSR